MDIFLYVEVTEMFFFATIHVIHSFDEMRVFNLFLDNDSHVNLRLMIVSRSRA